MLERWSTWLLIAAAGGLGAMCRVAVGLLVQQRMPEGFPWGTLAANAMGCFAFGLLWTVAERYTPVEAHVKVYALGGFMGAFTTFSTYAHEAATMLRGGQYALAGLHLLTHNVLGLIFVLAGFALGQVLFGRAAVVSAGS